MPAKKKNISISFFINFLIIVSLFLGSCVAQGDNNKEEIDALVKEALKSVENRDYNRAKEMYKKVLRKDPQNLYAYSSLAFIEENLGALVNAKDLYEKAISLAPQNPELYYNLGNVYVKLQDGKKAKESYLKAVHFNPNHLNAYINLSIVSFHLGDYADAVKYCDEAVILGYDAPLEYLNTLQQFRR
ncbi:MAG TPA: tetratricopeptide repeat protein [Candidatus Omnitrophota bacterium]|nr:tetratricopeptide repeat protein [Candidatus Omnitrophota bacterium]HPN88301.1 tetratricopeptide repeat protein [Candidatus Omnitrophota bacterium]